MNSHSIPCSEETLQTLVRLVYEAVLEPACWKPFLEQFSLAVNGSSSALVVHDFAQSSGIISESVGIEPHWQKAYTEHFSNRNVWMRNAPQLLVPGVVAQTQQAIEDAELERSEFYNDYLLPQNFFYSFGGTFGKEGAVVSYLTALRSRQAGAFGAAEMSVIRYLIPHLECALRVHSHISGLEKRLNATASVLDSFPWAVILVDSRCQPILVNRAAQKIFDKSDGLSLTREGVRASSLDLTQTLRNALWSAILPERKTAAHGTALAIPRPSGSRAYEVLIVPIQGHKRLTEIPSAVAAMFISDPEQECPSDPEILRGLYGFTGAEARMAAALLQGRTVETAAEDFMISINTARTLVKRILSKTRTNRQTELVRLLMKSPARLRTGSQR